MTDPSEAELVAWLIREAELEIEALRAAIALALREQSAMMPRESSAMGADDDSEEADA